MSQTACISTREAAERLHVHARTIRKWIDVFEEYISPDINERGHYILSEESLRRLADIQSRLQEHPQKSMKQVREELIREGKVPSNTHDSQKALLNQAKLEKMLFHIIESMENIEDMVEDVFHRMDRIEKQIYGLFNTIEEMEHRLINAQIENIPMGDLQKMFDEIRKKQDQLRIELRNVSFTQRLTAATSEQGLLSRRQKKTRFFGMF